VDEAGLFGQLPVQRRALRHAERLLLLALPDHQPGARLATVKRQDEPVCRRLLKRELVIVRLIPASHTGDRPKMKAARLPAALPLLTA
jgi:hypothetical protein